LIKTQFPPPQGGGQGRGKMNILDKGVNKFGKLIVASFFLMGIGLVLFLLTPLLYGLWGIDSDIPGMLIVFLGLVLFIVGWIRNRKPNKGVKIALIVLASLLSIPLLMFIVTTIIYLITGQPLGE
jgi:membrane protease YdiL (CAAX protease family)